MPAKPTFTPDQQQIIHAAAKRVWKKSFAWMKKTPEHPAGQEAMALALGVTQQTVSSLLKGTYHPGLKVARAIANLDGQTLEMLIGDFAELEAPQPSLPVTQGSFANLDVCLQFHAASKQWSPWTIAAARAGFWGNSDFAPPEWSGKLDMLEKVLDRAKKTA